MTPVPADGRASEGESRVWDGGFGVGGAGNGEMQYDEALERALGGSGHRGFEFWYLNLHPTFP